MIKKETFFPHGQKKKKKQENVKDVQPDQPTKRGEKKDLINCNSPVCEKTLENKKKNMIKIIQKSVALQQ